MQFYKLFFILCFVTSACFAQDTKQGWNDYAEHSQLTWDDFKGKNPNTDATAAAEVNTSLEFKWGYQTIGIDINFLYEVLAMQNPNASWVDSNQKTLRVLNHEQIHFDITELHARMFRKWLSEFDYINTRNLRRQLNGKYTKVKIAWKRMQQEYDLETNHGILFVTHQENWNKKIADLLIEFAAFKS